MADRLVRSGVSLRRLESSPGTNWTYSRSTLNKQEEPDRKIMEHIDAISFSSFSSPSISDVTERFSIAGIVRLLKNDSQKVDT